MRVAVICALAVSALPVSAAPISASGIIGQGGVYTSSTLNYPSGTINALGLSGTDSVIVDKVNHRLIIADGNNKRIVFYDLDGNNSISDTSAKHVLGACDFVSAGTGALDAKSFGDAGHAFNLAYDAVNARLFVSDWNYDRVLMFLVSPGFSDCENATAVFGQSGFTTNAGTDLANPDDMDVDTVNNRLFVSAQSGGFVRVYNAPLGVTGGVTSILFSLGTGSGALAQNTLNQPLGNAYDSINSRVFVSDGGNNRVMVFPVPASCDSGCSGENATFVLGQPDFATNTGSNGQAKLNTPDDNNYDTAGNRFWVTDYANNRIMSWTVPSNATASFNGANATAEINNVSWTGGTIGTAPTQNSFTRPESPHGFDSAHNRYFIYEYVSGGSPSNGYRVLQLNFINIITATLPNGVLNSAYSQGVSVSQTQGTSQTYSITSGALPNGLSISSSTGAITGTPSMSGAFSFTVQAADNFSDGSVFFDQHAYSVNVSGFVANPSVFPIQ